MGIFGAYGPLTYRSYVVSSLDARGFESLNIREARQNGSEEIAQDFSWVGRLDYTPISGLVLGGSAYVGDSGQGKEYAGAKADVKLSGTVADPLPWEPEYARIRPAYFDAADQRIAYLVEYLDYQ